LIYLWCYNCKLFCGIRLYFCILKCFWYFNFLIQNKMLYTVNKSLASWCLVHFFFSNIVFFIFRWVSLLGLHDWLVLKGEMCLILVTFVNSYPDGCLLQILLGLPFLVSHPVAYISGAFNLGRVFIHFWYLVF